MPKKLYKSENGKIIDGVCGGIAAYLNLDPTVVRLVFAIAALFGGFGLFAYILCAIIIPRNPGDFLED